MNNKCQLENALTLTKSIAMLYVNATIESSNKKVNEVMDNGLKASLKMQQELYQMMKEDNYYQTSNVSSTAINKILTKISKQGN